MADPRVFQAVHEDRRNPGKSDRRAGGRSLEARLSASRAEGLADGLMAGAARAREDVASLVSALAEARRQIDGSRDEMLDACVVSVARLAVKIAEKILGEKLRTDPETMKALVSSALAPMRGCGPIEVSLNTGDVARCEAAGVALHVAEGMTIVPDESIPEGGCRVRTEWGGVDGGVSEQLRRVEQIFEAEAARG